MDLVVIRNERPGIWSIRQAELDQDDGFFVGPLPCALFTKAASTNQDERFEEVTRIMGVEPNIPYDIVGVNHKMAAKNLKKRYWKLSLMVHPDKCTHPQAHQAFIKLNKAFKDLQHPDKRKALDDKIMKKEEEEEMKAELRSMCEAAFWRRSQGLSMEGDDVLLAELDMKEPSKRDEWMTSLPPERKFCSQLLQSVIAIFSGVSARARTTSNDGREVTKCHHTVISIYELLISLFLVGLAVI
ncbi:hypothetical protein RND81_07G041800 [Saponaria officinalis]|uniref:J domain-containing protein n=1 Tax=Saponaria officinalis TaxID=3572 RepID=A0AAW1JRF0_SAPOF